MGDLYSATLLEATRRAHMSPLAGNGGADHFMAAGKRCECVVSVSRKTGRAYTRWYYDCRRISHDEARRIATQEQNDGK